MAIPYRFLRQWRIGLGWERIVPPIWTMVYWLIAPASTFEILGLILIIMGILIMDKEPQGTLGSYCL